MLSRVGVIVVRGLESPRSLPVDEADGVHDLSRLICMVPKRSLIFHVAASLVGGLVVRPM